VTLRKTEKEKQHSLIFIAGVNDTAKKMFTGVNNTAKKLFAGVSGTIDKFFTGVGALPLLACLDLKMKNNQKYNLHVKS
jgi:hypothetical protein